MTDKELCQAVETWGRAHRDGLVQDLIHIVAHKSVSEPDEGGYAFGTGCKNCADAMLALARSYGFQTENDDYYTVSVLRGGTGDGELGILGHLDVVPEGDGWNYEPYNAIEKDGFVIGRGSSDNKGAVIMSLYVMRALEELGVPMKHTVRLICGFNEEAGMKDVEHYLAGHQPPDYTIVCDGGWAMCIGEKGILNVDLTQNVHSGNLVEVQAGTARNAVPGTATALLADVDTAALQALAVGKDDVVVAAEAGMTRVTAQGKAAHAAFPWGGDNAIYKLLHFLHDSGVLMGDGAQAVANLAQIFTDDYGTSLGIAFEDKESGKTTCVGSVLTLQNGVLSLHIDIRYAITQDTQQLLSQLQAACETRSIRLESLSYSAPRYTDPEAPVTKMLMDTVHEFLGEEYKAYTMGGGTHARKFPNALPYGPGNIPIPNPFGNPHGIDEAVSVEALLLSMGTYAVALKRLDEML